MAKALLKNSNILLLMSLLALLFGGCSAPRAYASPELAVDSLVAALQSPDKTLLRNVLGSSGVDILKSGDPVADDNSRDHFLDAYNAKHTLVTGDDGDVTLVVGDNDWPLPIPLVKGDKGWSFDVAAGADEITSRRVGRNELDTIETCLAVVDAQREYAALDPEHLGVPAYAQKFASDPGKKNGLYWPTADNEPDSPLGPLAAEAQDLGYSFHAGGTKPQPFHGYVFRMLKAQGPDAQDGAIDYVNNGVMLLGFGVVAYPIEYGKSGVMTFIVNGDGEVYQRDLGDNTEELASHMTAFNPGPGWAKAASATQPSATQP